MNLHLAAIRSILDEIESSFLTCIRTSNLALPELGLGGPTFNALNDAIRESAETDLTLITISLTGLTTDINSLKAWCAEIVPTVRTLRFSIYS